MKEEKKWPENVNFWYKIADKSAELALSQVEDLLKETMSTAQSIQDKADKLISLIIPVFSALVVFILSDLDNWRNIIHLTAIFSLIVFLWSLYYLYFNIKAYTISNTGNNAETLINNIFISNNDTAQDQFLQIILQVCKDYKFRTNKNNTSNLVRSARNEKALKILVIGLPLSPIFAFTVYLLL